MMHPSLVSHVCSLDLSDLTLALGVRNPVQQTVTGYECKMYLVSGKISMPCNVEEGYCLLNAGAASLCGG